MLHTFSICTLKCVTRIFASHSMVLSIFRFNAYLQIVNEASTRIWFDLVQNGNFQEGNLNTFKSKTKCELKCLVYGIYIESFLYDRERK